MMRPGLARAAVMAAAALALSACSTVGGIAGAAAGIASGSFTSNPAIGVAVSVSVKAATDAGIKRLLRSLQQDEQDAIATLAGTMREGEVRPWRVRHKIPYGNSQGDMQVTRSIVTPLASCKEVMFTVNPSGAESTPDDVAGAWFTAQVCLQESGWKWANAEPAVERWGALH